MRYTANFSMKEPQKNIDLADVEDLNDNLEVIDEIMHNAQISIAEAYDSTQTYDVGDVVMYEGLLYKCITAITVAEAWDSTKWERTTAATSGGGGNANVTEITYAQYTNLTPAEKANGTIYCVTDDPNDSSGGGGGISFSTVEQNTGIKWIDGNDIYQKTISFNSAVTISQNNWTDLGVASTGIDTLIDAIASNTGVCWGCINVSKAVISGYLAALTSRNGDSISVNALTIRYTKTS